MEAAGGVAVEEGVMRVLLVDDSPVDRRVAQLLLSSNSCAGSFHVIAVDSAKKAMEFLGLKDGGGKELAIDMVLTDYCMPEMTGYDLLKAVKALNPLKPIPVIVMSSEDEPQRISRCLNAGAEDFIVKPLQSKDVQRLRNCSTAARPSSKGSAAPCEAAAVAKRNNKPPLVLPPSAVATSPSGRRANLAGVAMVLHSSSVELSAVPAAPAQARRAGIRRAVAGRAPAQMVIGWPLLPVPVARLSSKQQSQQRCSAVVQPWARTGG